MRDFNFSKKCSEKILILRRIYQDIVINGHKYSRIVHATLVTF